MKKPLLVVGVLAALLVVGSTGYIIGVYHLAKTDVGDQILVAANIDLRPPAMQAAKMEEQINTERTKAGLPAASHSEKLAQSACMKLDDMTQKDYWAHNAPDGTQPWFFFLKAGYKYRNAGENLAYGQRDEATTVSEWMNSPKHKDNILGDYSEQGVCTKSIKFQRGYVNLTVSHFGAPY